MMQIWREQNCSWNKYPKLPLLTTSEERTANMCQAYTGNPMKNNFINFSLVEYFLPNSPDITGCKTVLQCIQMILI